MYIGIDLGGTNIAAGIVEKNGKILTKDSCPTFANRHYSEVIKDMADLCFELTQKGDFSINDITEIGIGSPGAVDGRAGIVLDSGNLNWNNVPLASEFKKYINVPIKLENDANSAAYGEYFFNGYNAESFIAVTLGTGIGSGIIINNNIYRGLNGAGGELGHFTFIHEGEKCPCGNYGCWETYASVTALIRQTKDAIKEYPNSSMARYEIINGKTAFDEAKSGDKVAQKVVNKYIEYVAGGILSIVNTLRPDVIVIGGGISKEGDYLIEPVKKYINNHTNCKSVEVPEIKAATLGNDAGIIGAALFPI